MKNIKAIIFDVDGTLYKSPQVVAAIKKHWVNRIACRFHLSERQATWKLNDIKKTFGSSTEGLKQLGLGSLNDIAHQSERCYTSQLIRKDRALVAGISRLSTRYRLFLLRNGLRSGTYQILRFLGFAVKHYNNIYYCSSFEKVFATIDDFGVMKPDVKPFEGIISYTKLKPDEHLIIGDRVAVDLTPAKKLGMQTALVTWGEQVANNDSVDFYLQTIYDVERLF